MLEQNLHFGNLKYFGQIGVAQQQDVVDILPGQYSGLYIILSGINDTGDDWEFSDGARVKILKGGTELVNMPLGFLSDLTNMKGGATDNSSATAGAVQQAAVVPFGLVIENSVIFKNNQANVCIIDLGTSFGDLASGSIEVYGIKARFPNRYEPLFFDHTIASFTGTFNFQLPVGNLLELFGVGATPGNVANLRLELDKDNIEDASYLALHTFANHRNRVESGLTYFDLTPQTIGDLRESAAAKTILVIRNSAATAVTLYIFSFNPPENYDESQQNVQQDLAIRQQKIASERPGAAKDLKLFREVS